MGKEMESEAGLGPFQEEQGWGPELLQLGLTGLDLCSEDPLSCDAKGRGASQG